MERVSQRRHFQYWVGVRSEVMKMDAIIDQKLIEKGRKQRSELIYFSTSYVSVFFH